MVPLRGASALHMLECLVPIILPEEEQKIKQRMKMTKLQIFGKQIVCKFTKIF